MFVSTFVVGKQPPAGRHPRRRSVPNTHQGSVRVPKHQISRVRIASELSMISSARRLRLPSRTCRRKRRRSFHVQEKTGNVRHGMGPFHPKNVHGIFLLEGGLASRASCMAKTPRFILARGGNECDESGSMVVRVCYLGCGFGRLEGLPAAGAHPIRFGQCRDSGSR